MTRSQRATFRAMLPVIREWSIFFIGTAIALLIIYELPLILYLIK